MTKPKKKQLKANLNYFNRFKKDDPLKNPSSKWGYGSIEVEHDEQKIDPDIARAIQNLHAIAFGIELHNNLFN